MTKIFYKIIESDPSDLQISVRFFSDKLPESELMVDVGRARTDYAISLPVPIPAGDALHELIMRACPIEWFAAMHAARDPNVDTGMPHIAIGTVREVTPVVREPTEMEIIAAGIAGIDQLLNTTAKSYGYDSIVTMCSYASSMAESASATVARYRTEGQAALEWRSLCYAKGEEIRDAVKAGERAQPTVAELVAEMPQIGLDYSGRFAA